MNEKRYRFIVEKVHCIRMKELLKKRLDKSTKSIAKAESEKMKEKISRLNKVFSRLKKIEISLGDLKCQNQKKQK